MNRGDLFRVYKGMLHDPKNYRVFVVVSRQALVDSKFSTVICAPVYRNYSGISTQVPVGPDEGLKHQSCIFCDELISIPKNNLTDYIGSLSWGKVLEMDCALKIAIDVEG